MRTKTMILSLFVAFFLAIGQIANAAPQTKSEALLQVIKLLSCNGAYLDELRNFSEKASLRRKMEKIVRKFTTLCNITTRNSEGAISLQNRFDQHNKLVISHTKRSNLDEKVRMQEFFHCMSKDVAQENYLKAKKIVLRFANSSETRSINKASKRLQKKWNQICAMPRGTQAEKKKFIRKIPSLWKAFREHNKAMRSALVS